MGFVWSRPTPSAAASSSSPALPAQQKQQRFRVKKVAIIGAGPAGLAAARYLRAQGAVDSITVFEQQHQVGGVWLYSGLAPKEVPVPQQDPFWGPEPAIWPDGADAPVFPSPMYERLHANIPGSLMRFHDREFPSDAWAFPKREEIQEYLVRYAEDLRHLIKFCHEVTRVSLETRDGRDQWHVEAKSTLNDDEVVRETYDAVVVANGHYSVPYVPTITNIEEFNRAHPNIITHSKQYRRSDGFKGKKVIIVGNGPSGLDVAYQINQVAGKTLLSVRHATSPEKLAHIGCEEVPEIVEFLPDQRGVRFTDGSVESDVDHIVFCTGFLFGYPFLQDLNHKVITSGRGVHGLYQHLFLIEHPTLVFPALNMKSVPWPLAESQAALFSAVWSNDLELPSDEEMWRWSRELEERQGEALHVYPAFGDDGKHINEMYDWVKTAKHVGKEPPRWDGENFWQRSICVEAKIKFEDDGCRAKTLAELGYHYDPDKEYKE
ncbi:FAD/NAD(P)-binding domain-containing protein [Trichoderma longibrachiatum]|uniref:FAD/NAD(P)-binding domain-containing protein n=1 Tax=Trichoderma longibrachiatum ATCC 18648 TaxID=983965 RepID=A0A2T4BYD4_TRILO|nr:FAD/NAD(P)-binding domain-containing protein [Trichoderma longibrachiatum ATCC 18648]